jgi:hypothetical protein
MMGAILLAMGCILVAASFSGGKNAFGCGLIGGCFVMLGLAGLLG